jgi:hypothetical protein
MVPPYEYQNEFSGAWGGAVHHLRSAMHGPPRFRLDACFVSTDSADPVRRNRGRPPRWVRAVQHGRHQAWQRRPPVHRRGGCVARDYSDHSAGVPQKTLAASVIPAMAGSPVTPGVHAEPAGESRGRLTRRIDAGIDQVDIDQGAADPTAPHPVDRKGDAMAVAGRSSRDAAVTRKKPPVGPGVVARRAEPRLRSRRAGTGCGRRRSHPPGRRGRSDGRCRSR